MLTLEPRIDTTQLPGARVPVLENGAHLDAREFLRRFEAMPHVKKAELINGVVFMASPVRVLQHGIPDGITHAWLGGYAMSTPCVRFAPNITLHLAASEVAQPDGCLYLLPEKGGKTHVDIDGYLSGPPELIVEIAASSASYDAREKLEIYRRAGVAEYLIWCTEDETLDWLALDKDEYRPLVPGDDGFLRSRVFPGLWLDWRALLQRHGSGVMDALRHGLLSDEHARFII